MYVHKLNKLADRFESKIHKLAKVQPKEDMAFIRKCQTGANLILSNLPTLEQSLGKDSLYLPELYCQEIFKQQINPSSYSSALQTILSNFKQLSDFMSKLKNNTEYAIKLSLPAQAQALNTINYIINDINQFISANNINESSGVDSSGPDSK